MSFIIDELPDKTKLRKQKKIFQIRGAEIEIARIYMPPFTWSKINHVENSLIVLTTDEDGETLTVVDSEEELNNLNTPKEGEISPKKNLYYLINKNDLKPFYGQT
jgi:hypothetical protein